MHEPMFRAVVVDNRRAANMLLSGALEMAGFDVFSTTNTLECFNRIDTLKGRIDIVVVEGGLATERSEPIIDRVRKINPKIKIIVTARTRAIRETVEEFKPDYVAVAPTSVQTIVDKVLTLLLSDMTPSSLQ